MSRHRLWLPVLALCAASLGTGCARPESPRAPAFHWVAGCAEPGFDPGGPPEPVRWALERLLTRGLVSTDSSGRVVPDAAERWEWSPDSLTLTFHLRAGMRFVDGSPCGSGDFARALTRGLARTDHGTQAWLLAAVRGVDRVRAGRPLPALGIETPDALTLVLRLTRPDPDLPGSLALPGVSSPWSQAATGSWLGAPGLGPWRAVAGEPGRSLVLTRASGMGATDTLGIRFLLAGPRVLATLRAGSCDLLWPVPPALDLAPPPPAYQLRAAEASPGRTLLLVARADLPPTLRLPARHALAHGLNRNEVLRALGPRGRDLVSWLPGAGPFDFPALDEALVHEWMARARLGRAFHVVLTYDADGVGAVVARVLQGEWSRLGIYAELKPLRGARLEQDLLGGLSHLALVEAQPLRDGTPAALAMLVMPLRGPAVGGFRTGWRTREFDAWLLPRPGTPPPDPAATQDRLAEERIAIPLARLPWLWLERSGGPGVRFHPRFGPECPAPRGGDAVPPPGAASHR